MSVIRNTRKKSLRFIAILSALYGIAALIAACMLSFHLWKHPHTDIASLFTRYPIADLFPHPGLLSKLFDEVGHVSILSVILLLLLYAAARMVEFIGLWRLTSWGELFCAFSALLYVPFEIESMIHAVTWFNLFSFIFNLTVAGYMIRNLKQKVMSTNQHS